MHEELDVSSNYNTFQIKNKVLWHSSFSEAATIILFLLDFHFNRAFKYTFSVGYKVPTEAPF